MMICNQCKEVKHSKCENIQKTGQPLGSWCACQHREVVLIRTGDAFSAPTDGNYSFTKSSDSPFTQVELITDAGLPEDVIEFKLYGNIVGKIENLGTDV